MARPSVLHRSDGGQNLLGKGDHQTAEQAEEALRALAGIMGLDGHPHLHDAPAQDNDAQGLDDGKDEVAHIVYDSQRVA